MPPAIRREIQQSELSERKLAVKYGISRDTVRKWKRCDTVEDYSHTPHNLNTSLTPSHDAVVIDLRTTLLLSIDDLLVVVRKLLYPEMSRSALDRYLRRHGILNLKKLFPEEAKQKKQLKTFKDYKLGFLRSC